MDETGFQMSQNQAEYIVYNSTQEQPVKAASENTNWVIIIKYITVRDSVKSYLIFKDKEPETDWFSDIYKLSDFIYAFFNKEWTDNELIIDWMKQVFLSETLNKQKHWILILNNHKSHILGKFQYLCLKNNVYLLFLSAHLSHKF